MPHDCYATENYFSFIYFLRALVFLYIFYFKRVQRAGFVAQELGTESGLTLTIGAIAEDNRFYNGRVACLKIYNTALTDEEVKALSENWACPHEPGKILW